MIVIVDYGMGNLRSILKKLEMIKVKAVISSKVEDIKSAEKLIFPGVGHFGQGMKNIKEYGLLPVLNTKVLEEKTPILGVCLGMQLFSEWSEEGNVAGLGWIKGKIVRFHFDDKSQEFSDDVSQESSDDRIQEFSDDRFQKFSDDRFQKFSDDRFQKFSDDRFQKFSDDRFQEFSDDKPQVLKRMAKKLSIPHVGWNTIDIRKDSSLIKGISRSTRFYFTHSYHFDELEEEYVIATTSYGYDFPSIIKRDNMYGTQFHPEKSHLTGLEIYKNFIDYT
ncbi:imidazole glycerol phosphate synthase subunit HisH [Candidatus Peregrinibacteria bacterium]|nr:imidazole glycerol phosphate synthase subunit HisH [Candidatus Peregrinibacteria bacterium]